MAHFTVTDNREPNRRDAVGLAGMIRGKIERLEKALKLPPYSRLSYEQQTRLLRQLRRNLRYVRACKATRQRDKWKARRNAELAEAGRLLKENTESCPTEVYGWQHPKTCAAACKNYSMAGCWSLYIEQRAQTKEGW